VKSCFALVSACALATLSNCRDLSPSQWYRLGSERISGTAAKVVGMVRIHWIETIGSQALRVFQIYGCSSQTKWQWVWTCDNGTSA